MRKVKIIFNGMTAEISEETFMKREFDVDFNGRLKVRFQWGGIFQNINNIKPINAMDGYGNNCFDDIKDDRPTIII